MGKRRDSSGVLFTTFFFVWRRVQANFTGLRDFLFPFGPARLEPLAGDHVARCRVDRLRVRRVDDPIELAAIGSGNAGGA